MKKFLFYQKRERHKMSEEEIRVEVGSQVFASDFKCTKKKKNLS